MNEVQVICTVVSADKINDPDIAALIGTSAALAISGIPFQGQSLVLGSVILKKQVTRLTNV